jgi:hypothetical protein
MAVRLLRALGHLESNLPLESKLQQISATTLCVLNAQINEILSIEFNAPPDKFQTPCYFAMSIYDPMLHFEPTLAILNRHFANLSPLRLTYPFHQPPRPFTFDELNRDFSGTVETFLRGSHPETSNAAMIET